jgi:hypothetical protein
MQADPPPREILSVHFRRHNKVQLSPSPFGPRWVWALPLLLLLLLLGRSRPCGGKKKMRLSVEKLKGPERGLIRVSWDHCALATLHFSSIYYIYGTYSVLTRNPFSPWG